MIAATVRAEIALDQMDLAFPAAVVIGNEGRGIHPSLLSVCAAQARTAYAAAVDARQGR